MSYPCEGLRDFMLLAYAEERITLCEEIYTTEGKHSPSLLL
jgi:hypothetical protein